MSTLGVNKKAGFDYKILETYEAGLVLSGPEVKSIKDGHISLKESYVDVLTTNPNHLELYLLKAHVSPYRPAGKMDEYNPTRPRKLLLHQKEIVHLLTKKQQVGLTLIPIKIYTKNSFIKLEFALAQGRKKYDKRDVIKKRDVERSLRILTKKR
ncbi:MAG: SsrA-binding protein SmpB [Candidatus Falkowbacteria bacterium]